MSSNAETAAICWDNAYPYHEQMASRLFTQPVWQYGVPTNNDGSPWEPESSQCFSKLEGLYNFKTILNTIPNFTVLPNLRRDFQYATLGMMPKDPDSALNDFAFRSRFNFIAPNASYGRRHHKDIHVGIKDAGKNTDRREFEVAMDTNLNYTNGLANLKNKYKGSLPATLQTVKATDFVVGGVGAVSRAGFFGQHYIPELNAMTTYSASLDACLFMPPWLQDTRGNIITSNNRYESEIEIDHVYSPDQNLSPEALREIINTSLNKVIAGLNAVNQPLLLRDMNMNKTEGIISAPRNDFTHAAMIAASIKPEAYASRSMSFSRQKAEAIYGSSRRVIITPACALNEAFNALPTTEQLHAIGRHEENKTLSFDLH